MTYSCFDSLEHQLNKINIGSTIATYIGVSNLIQVISKGK